MLVVLPDDFILDFEAVQEILFDHAEFQVGLALQNLKDKERAEDLFLLVLDLDLVFVFVLLATDVRQGLLEHSLAMRGAQVSEIGQSLDPEVSARRRVAVGGVLVLSTHLHNGIHVVLLDVVVQQLLLQTEALTALFDTIWKVVDLEQKQDVVLVDLLIVASDELDDILSELLLFLVGDVRSPSFCLQLSTVQPILKETVVEIDLGEQPELLGVLLSEILDHII